MAGHHRNPTYYWGSISHGWLPRRKIAEHSQRSRVVNVTGAFYGCG